MALLSLVLIGTGCELSLIHIQMCIRDSLCALGGGFPGKNASNLEFGNRIGYIYYWGRKDPFFGSIDGTANEKDVIYNADGEAISLECVNY